MTAKIDLVTRAFQDIGFKTIKGNEVDVGVRNMDDMILSWETEGINISYNDSLPTNPLDDSLVDRSNHSAVIKNLAVILGDIYDVIISPAYMMSSISLKSALYSIDPESYEPDSMMPKGSGNCYNSNGIYNNRFQNDEDRVQSESGQNIITE